MQAEVAAVVSTAQLAAQQGRVASASAHTAHAALHSAQAHAQKVTGDFLHDFYERKIFDPYLTFGSAEEEQAYREREEARQRAIEAARALGTPHGDLEALRLSREQLEDAGRHGADRSPDYAPTISGLRGAEAQLQRAIEMPETGARPEQSVEGAPDFDPAIISPEILANLRSAGVTIPASDPALAVSAGSRASTGSRVPS